MPHIVEEFAPAKINLALHVTGQRSDGYHLIETIVAFADVGDRLTVQDAQSDAFTICGPFASALSGDRGNLVLDARDAMRADAGCSRPVSIQLEKNLPVASGMGGGSADAAACLRGLRRLWSLPHSDAELAEIGAALGADVPMCLTSKPLFASGIGDEIEPIAALPTMQMVLVNPNLAVSTPEVFKRLMHKTNPGIILPACGSSEDWITALTSMRNDLEPPAETVLPAVVECRSALSDSGALIARMSGSGATCFGIYGDGQKAADAADAIRSTHPTWYVCATSTLSG